MPLSNIPPSKQLRDVLNDASWTGVDHMRVSIALPIILSLTEGRQINIRCERDVLSVITGVGAEYDLLRSVVSYCFTHYGALANSASYETILANGSIKRCETTLKYHFKYSS